MASPRSGRQRRDLARPSILSPASRAHILRVAVPYRSCAAFGSTGSSFFLLTRGAKAIDTFPLPLLAMRIRFFNRSILEDSARNARSDGTEQSLREVPQIADRARDSRVARIVRNRHVRHVFHAAKLSNGH